MKFWPLSSYHKRSDLLKLFIFEIKKIHTAQAYQNGVKLNYIHPLQFYKKIFNRSIQAIAKWNSQEKIKSIIPHEQNTWLDWSKTAKQFSVNSHGKFLCQYQASR